MTNTVDEKSRPMAKITPDVENLIDQKQYQHELIASSRSIPEQRDLISARSTIRLSALSIVAFFTWAAITPVHELTAAHGSIIPEGFVQSVQHLEGGLVSRVLVDNGSRVNAGDALVELDTVALQAERAKAVSRLESLRLRAERLSALAEGRLARPTGEPGSERIANSHWSAGAMKLSHLEARLQVLDAEIQARLAEADGLDAQMRVVRAELQLVTPRANSLASAAERGSVSGRDSDNLQREKLRLEGDLATKLAQKAGLTAKVAELNAQKAEIRSQFGADAMEELSKVETERAEVIALVEQLDDRFHRAVLRSPVSGLVQSIEVRGPGRVVRPGEQVAEIVPDQHSVFAQIEIPADRIGFVTPGQAAVVKITAYDYARYGAIEGVVERISPSNSRTDDDRNVFIARVRLNSMQVGTEPGDRPVKPGMGVVVDIRVGRKSVLDYLTKPIWSVAGRALTER